MSKDIAAIIASGVTDVPHAILVGALIFGVCYIVGSIFR